MQKSNSATPQVIARRKPAASRWYLRALLIVCLLAIIPAGIGLTAFWIYGTDTQHANRDSIWWSERGRNLIPPGATDIALRQELLAHYAIYRISEPELHDFLNRRFAEGGTTLDSFGSRTPVSAEKIGNKVGELGFSVTEDTVLYSYPASNGGMHNYYHDSKTGETYQESAYW